MDALIQKPFIFLHLSLSMAVSITDLVTCVALMNVLQRRRRLVADWDSPAVTFSTARRPLEAAHSPCCHHARFVRHPTPLEMD